jgi:hypothetical protein
MYVAENRLVSESPKAIARKTGEPKITGKCHDVIENKRRKNVRFQVCHDVDENKVDTGSLPRCC